MTKPGMTRNTLSWHRGSNRCQIHSDNANDRLKPRPGHFVVPESTANGVHVS